MVAKAPPLRVVFDTNIVISTLVFGRSLAWLRGAWANRSVTPLVCYETVLELMDVLNYTKFKLTVERQEDLLQDYLPFAETVELPVPLLKLPVACWDFDDELFLHLAIFAKADCIVTGDADLLALANVAPVAVKTIQDWQAGL